MRSEISTSDRVDTGRQPGADAGVDGGWSGDGGLRRARAFEASWALEKPSVRAQRLVAPRRARSSGNLLAWRPAMLRTRSLLAGTLSLLVLSSAAACIGGATDRVTGTSAFSGRSGRSSTGTIDPALVGRWSRTTFFDDNQGFLHSSQLVWEFNSDGGARRIIVTSNISLGLVDTEVVLGIWGASGGVVEITLLPPASGTLRFPYTVAASRLLLGPFDLERLL